MRDRLLILRSSLLILALLARDANAQVIRVRVLDAGRNTPLSNADVRVSGLGDSLATQARTGKAGLARLVLPSWPPPRARVLTLSVRALGFAPATQAVEMAPNDLLSVDVSLTAAATPLSVVRIVGRREGSWWLREFEERRARMNGSFIDREDIERRGATQLSELLRGLPGIVLIPYEGRYVLASERAAPRLDGEPCHVAYYLDGVPLPADPLAGIDVVMSVSELDAVEVYSGGARIPPRFNQSNARCGVVAFWSRSPK